MKKFIAVLAAVFAAGLCAQAGAAEIEFHGDLNNRFNLYTNQANMFSSVEGVRFNQDNEAAEDRAIQEDGVDELWGDIKYRLWTTAATNDGAVRGTYAIELGAIRYGNSDRGGAFSGDDENIETRWAYTDFAVPNTDGRVFIGLQPFAVNSYVWKETAMGVQYKGKADAFDYRLAWMRGREFFNGDDDDDLLEDVDSFLVRGDFSPAQDVEAGVFGLYQRSDSLVSGTDSDLSSSYPGSNYLVKQFAESDFDMYTLGTDGSLNTPTDFGNFFVNWDLMYQGGEIENDISEDADISAFFLHADVGVNIDRLKLTYTGWYASGDDDPGDGDRDNFTATDVDTFDSIIFFEGGYTDDNYFTEAPYILDRGMIFNRLGADYKATQKTTIGGALIYAMTAEDLPNGEDKLGLEIDAYISHKLYSNLEVALNAGYLFADDAMGYFSETGDEEDVFRTTARVRYGF